MLSLKKNKVLLVCIMISLIIAIMASSNRIQIESNNKNVDIIIDYSELNQLAKQNNEDISIWLELFKEQGVNKVGVSEESLHFLMEEGKPVKADIMQKVVQDIHWMDELPENLINKIYSNNGQFDPNDVLVKTSSEELFDFMKNAIEERFDSDKHFTAKNEHTYFIWLDGMPKDTLYENKGKLFETDEKPYTQIRNSAYSKLMYISLGFDEEKLQKVIHADMQVIPRTVGFDGWNDEKFEAAVIDEYKALNEVPEYILFAGLEIIGQDAGSKGITAYIKENNIKIGIVESTFQRGHNDQTGLFELVESMKYNVVRTFTTWNYIQNRYQYYNYPGSEEIENTFFRAITERNIRLIYFKPFKEYKDDFVYVTDKAEYTRMLDSLKMRINKHNIQLGTASVMPPYEMSAGKEILISMGAVAGAIILLTAFIELRNKYKYGLFGIGLIGVIGAFMVNAQLAELISALTASIVFPSLAIYYLLWRSRQYQETLTHDEKLSKTIFFGVKELLITSGISIIGAVLAASVIADIDFFLELSFFRGVKLAQLTPILVFLLLYISIFSTKKKSRKKFEFNDIIEILTSNIQVWVVIVGGIVLAAGYVYIARTGHETALEPTKIEMIFRNFLEENLIARPRNKEFLIAFPALMITVYMLIRKFRKWIPALFGIAAVIGQTSIVNTFVHMRTPMYLSVARTGYSLIFGIFLGMVYIIGLEGLMVIMNRIKGEK